MVFRTMGISSMARRPMALFFLSKACSFLRMDPLSVVLIPHETSFAIRKQTFDALFKLSKIARLRPRSSQLERDLDLKQELGERGQVLLHKKRQVLELLDVKHPIRSSHTFPFKDNSIAITRDDPLLVVLSVEIGKECCELSFVVPLDRL